MPTGAGISLAIMEANVLQQLGVDATDIDASGSANLDLMINKSWWEVMDKFDFREKEAFSDITLIVSQGQYSFSTILSPIVFDALQQVAISDPNTGQFTPLDEVSIRKFTQDYSTDVTLNDIPVEYVRDNGNITFWPYPDQAYTVRLYYWQVLADVPSGGPIVPQAWHEIIEMGAIYRGHLWLRDFNSAAKVRNHQLSLISTTATNSGKEDRNNKMAGVSVPTREFGRRY